MKKLGRLEKVDLLELWNGEDSDFTAWLSQEDNIAEVGNVIGMELEVQKQGPKSDLFREEILCKDTVTDQYVVIGDQLEKSDHTHLGKIITCAADKEALAVVWVASAFNEEHRATLKWLNNITGDSFSFFGIEVEAYRIGDSLPAPGFKVVVKPEEKTRQEKTAEPVQKLSDTDILQLQFWHGLKNFMEDNNSFVKLLGTPPKSWFNIAVDKGRYFLIPSINHQENSLNISLTIIGEKAKEDFERLYEIAYEDSLIEISKEIVWYKLQANIRSVITLKTYADFTDRSDWTNQFAWFKMYLERFDKFFRPKIRQLCQ